MSSEVSTKMGLHEYNILLLNQTTQRQLSLAIPQWVGQ